MSVVKRSTVRSRLNQTKLIPPCLKFGRHGHFSSDFMHNILTKPLVHVLADQLHSHCLKWMEIPDLVDV